MKIKWKRLRCSVERETCYYACETCTHLYYSKEGLKKQIGKCHTMERKQVHCHYCRKSFLREKNKKCHENNSRHGADKYTINFVNQL